ncbi:plasma membrane-associated cation-binding protein 1-like [Telopea speciosissima]|uniref:plasma membrane-associated cation-binding protein 1-like n=1 Tax=Telopea speciosissima TaxID=54955 RepID=UPI001CC815C3|nr:plasma membrane-associated cation-binding protein 1-like [Telopea speciosissima]
MGYWNSKVVPKIKRVFEKNGNRKAAAEACKSFDDSKEEINKEFEEKKTDLQPKVIEVYEASSAEIKTLVKERTDEGIKKNPEAVKAFLEELEKIEFPGSKQVSEASSKVGPVLISGPVLFVLEKVSTFVVTEEKPAASTEAATETTEAETQTETITTTTTPPPITEETLISVKDKEIATEEVKKEEEVVVVKVTEPAAAAPVEETKTEKKKTDETAEPVAPAPAPASSEPPKAVEAVVVPPKP